ncbi:IS110 family transposase [Streptomyces sp. NPDC051001]|uniref:IS110 family transposase n=1 Tax=Streptomyces sp. NPDC051001 TaxID=3155795 RepID=UPI003417196F
MFELTYAGLDVHARSVVGAAIDGVSGEIRSLRLAPETDAVVAWVVSLPGPVAAAYEAGPTGFGLARALTVAGVRCVVVAPSKVERPPGDRVKTDRRDAERLARLLRIGELPAVRVPTEAEEAARDLVRAREDVRGDLMRARHRLSKLLLRRGLVWQGSAWTQEHESWLRSLSFERLGVQLAFDEAFDTVLSTCARRGRLDGAIEQMAAVSPFAPVVGRLRCLRGVSTLTAFGLAVEVGDWHRFTGATIGSYLGLVPSEASSGERRVQGAITKTGNSHARRLLVEASWHHRKRYRPSRELMRRQAGQPPAVRDRAERGNRRLNQRWKRFDARNKRPTIAAVAVARELAGWCWSLAVMDEPS